jgi:hypothetical protein
MMTDGQWKEVVARRARFDAQGNCGPCNTRCVIDRADGGADQCPNCDAYGIFTLHGDEGVDLVDRCLWLEGLLQDMAEDGKAVVELLRLRQANARMRAALEMIANTSDHPFTADLADAGLKTADA